MDRHFRKRYRLHSRHKGPIYRLRRVYAKPEGRMYSPPEEDDFYGQQSESDVKNHHTGPEFHGPYRDQAKEISSNEVEENVEETEEEDEYQSHFPLKQVKEEENEESEEAEDTNGIDSQLERPLLTFHLNPKKPEIEAHQIRLIKPKPHSYSSQNHTDRKIHPDHIYEGIIYDKESPSQYKGFDATPKSHNHHRHYLESGEGSSKPRMRIDLTRIKLIPAVNDNEDERVQRPMDIESRYYGYRRPELKVPRHLVKLKRKNIGEI